MLSHRHSHRTGPPGAASRLAHAGINAEDLSQADDSQNPQHPILRRGQQQVTPRPPGLHQRRHSAGVNKLQARQIDDYLPRPGRDPGLRGSDSRGVCYVKLPPQRNNSLTVAFADTQINADHGCAFLRLQQGGVLTRQLVHQYSP
jgi:hypothetical protein